MSLRDVIRQKVWEAFNFDNNKTFTPPHSVALNSSNALKVIAKKDLTSNGGNEGSGKRKAMELSNKEVQSLEQMRRMKAFFDNNTVAAQKEKSAGKTEETSGTLQAWALHGGDEGYQWVNSELDRLHDSNMQTKDTLRKAGGAGDNKGMGVFDDKMMSTTNTRTHSAWSKVKNREQNR